MSFRNSIFSLSVLVAGGTVHAAPCSWNIPGANPTVGPIESAVALFNMVNGPALVAKIKAQDYSEVVTIKKNDRRMVDMTSGGTGRTTLCKGAVDTSQWLTDHEEQGRVYRVNGDWLVWFWKCKNLSRWLPAPVEASLQVVPTSTSTEPTSFQSSATPKSAEVEPVTFVDQSKPVATELPGSTSRSSFVTPEYIIADPSLDPDPALTPPVDELSISYMLLIGSGLLFLKRKRS